jgi:hypothetical protein
MASDKMLRINTLCQRLIMLSRRRRELRLFGRGGTIDVHKGEPGRLVAAIVTQALADKMLAVWLCADARAGEMHLRYFGHGPDDTGQVQWWEMRAPPLGDYPLLLQEIITMTTLNEGLPVGGNLTARCGRVNFAIRVTINEIESVKLEWDEADVKQFWRVFRP